MKKFIQVSLNKIRSYQNFRKYSAWSCKFLLTNILTYCILDTTNDRTTWMRKDRGNQVRASHEYKQQTSPSFIHFFYKADVSF